MDTIPIRPGMGNQGPVLVTGSYRSGSTWTGQMLAFADELEYVHEPCNINHRPGIFSGQIPHQLTYITAETDTPFRGPMTRTLQLRYDWVAEIPALRTPRDVGRMVRDGIRFGRARRCGRRPLVKDPMALLSAGWFSEVFGARVVVVIRHPAGFVASCLKLGWDHSFEPALQQFLDQRGFLDSRVPHLRDELEELKSRPSTPVERAAMAWRVLHEAVRRDQEEHPDWLFVRHEDLAADPVRGFEAIYSHCGLAWNDTVAGDISDFNAERHAAEKNRSRATKRNSRQVAGNWRSRLSENDVELVLETCRDTADHFYPTEVTEERAAA